MGQKTHPKGFRLGVTRTWDSRWYAQGRQFGKFAAEDKWLRRELKEKLYTAGIAKIEIQRAVGKIIIDIHAARPGLVIGKKGSGIDALRDEMIKRLTIK